MLVARSQCRFPFANVRINILRRLMSFFSFFILRRRTTKSNKIDSRCDIAVKLLKSFKKREAPYLHSCSPASPSHSLSEAMERRKHFTREQELGQACLSCQCKCPLSQLCAKLFIGTRRMAIASIPKTSRTDLSRRAQLKAVRLSRARASAMLNKQITPPVNFQWTLISATYINTSRAR